MARNSSTLGYGHFANIEPALNQGILSMHDIVITDDTNDLVFIRPDGTLQVLHGITEEEMTAIRDAIAAVRNQGGSISYNDLTDQPKIPKNVSDLYNDNNYIRDANYVHTDNNFTNEDKEKLDDLVTSDEMENYMSTRLEEFEPEFLSNDELDMILYGEEIESEEGGDLDE